MDAQKASYSIAVMAKVLGVTRAGYDVWKNRVSHRGECTLVRRRLDEAVAWEQEVSGQYQAIAERGGELNLDTAAKLTGCRNVLAKRKNRGSDVDYGEDRALMLRLGLTGLNTRPRPRHSKRGGRGPVAHEDHCARQWGQGGLDRVWITDVTYLRCAQGWVYLCAVHDAH